MLERMINGRLLLFLDTSLHCPCIQICIVLREN